MIRNSTFSFLVCLMGSLSAFADKDLNPVKLHKAPRQEPVTLVRNGAAVGEIVALQGGRMVTAAVLDLQRLILATTGANLEIVDEPTGKPAIKIGDGPGAAALGLMGAKMPDEGFAIRTAQGTVYIVGNGEAGTTWGLNEFLERFVGVRWYWPEERGSAELVGTSVVKRKDLVVDPVWLSDAPVFRKRHRWPSGGPRIGLADMQAHDRRLRSFNSWPVAVRVHAPHSWAELYRKSRPEIFQLRSDGDRDFAMLCYGHPLTLRTYLEEIERQSLALASGNPLKSAEQIVVGKTITVSPNDMAVSCRCKHCLAMWDEEAGVYGTASRILGEFVASLGREVKKRRPDMTIIFLPYKNYTYAPKGIRFPDNVEVQICGMPGLAQYKDPVINAAEQSNIDAWVAMSGRRIQNWHYSCWPADRTKAAYLFPHTIRDHYRANRDKTVGSFINGIADHWPRQHVSLYVWLKVLWNPEFNVDAAIDEYCRRMYGQASRPMRKLVWMLIDGWEKREWSKHAFSPRAIYEESYPRKDVLEMEKLLEKSFAMAADDELTTKRLNYYAPSLRAFFAESKQYVDRTGVKPLDAFQVAEEPSVDGKLDETVWKEIEPATFVRALDTNRMETSFPTELKAVWTRRGITFGFRMTEPEPEKLKRDIGRDSRDASMQWWDDNVEIFLDVTGERSGYYQFIVNVNGALYDGKGKDTSWNSEGVRSAAFVGKDFWSLEVFIPTDTFPDAITPGTGVEWFGNFTRHRVTDRKNREYQRFNTTYAGPSDDQNAFGAVRFIER